MQTSAPELQAAAIAGRMSREFAQILTPEALDFVAALHRRFESRRQELLVERSAAAISAARR